MRILILVFVITFLATVTSSEAAWYVVDANNKVIVKCEYEPDAKDLRSRNETAVFSKEEIPLPDAECHSGKVTRRVKTPAEIAEENKKKDEEVDRKLIDEKLKIMAIEKLKSEGVTLKSQQNK